MKRPTHGQAVGLLATATDLADLAEAVGVLADDPATRPEELLAALDQPGFVAEQAAIALHRMTGAPRDEEGRPVVSRQFWQEELGRRGSAGDRRG